VLIDSINSWVYDWTMVLICCIYICILIFPYATKKDIHNSADLMERYKAAESVNDEQWKIQQRSLFAQCEAVADMKFTYVVSCRQYGNDKRAALANAQDILQLMRK
jgi:hypothetical protein